MKTIKQTLAAIVIAVIMAFTLNTAMATTIDASTTVGWTTDRYAPSSFVSTTVNGRQALQSTIAVTDSQNNRPSSYSSSFYNTQGKSSAVSASSGAWSFSADLNVTAGALAGTAGPSSQELWLGTGNNSGYYVMSLLSGVSARSYGAAPASGSMLGIFNDITGNWTYLSTAGLLAGWNTFNITSDGLDTVNYIVNGINVLTQTGMGGINGDVHIGELSTVYLEGYNYYGGTESSVRSDTSAWSATPESSVPDTASTAGLLGISIGGLALAGRRKFASQS